MRASITQSAHDPVTAQRPGRTVEPVSFPSSYRRPVRALTSPDNVSRARTDRLMQHRRKEVRMHLRRVTRSAAGVLVALSVSAAGIAAASGPHDGGPKPGKGCGDRNHVHYREAECGKPKPPA